MNDIHHLEAANLYCGDINPLNSTHLQIANLKLPTLEESFAEHTPGGAPIGVEISTHMMRLEVTFELVGWQPDIMALIGRERRDAQLFTAYGHMRSKRTAQSFQVKAIIEGRLGRVDPTEFRKGDNHSHAYRIGGIWHYELRYANEELYFWDFWTSERRARGIDLNADMNRELGIT
jgi:P2 family phage contractile tail tube protein